MAAINSVITSALDRAIDRLFDLSAISRYFTTFDPTPKTKISLSSPITLTGDFEINFKFSSTSTANMYLIAADANATECRLYRDATTGYFVMAIRKTNATTLYSVLDTTSSLADGKLYSGSLVKVGDDYTLTVNGFSKTVNEPLAEDWIITTLGIRADGNTNPWDGVISDVKIWDGGDRDTGTLVLDMPIDGSGYGTDTIVDNNQTVLGSELITNGSLGSDTGWIHNSEVNGTSSISGGIATVSGPTYAERGNIYQDVTMIIGAKYLVSVDVLSTSGGWVILPDSVVPVTETGRYEVIYTATQTTGRFQLRSQGGTSTFDNATMREVPSANPLGTAENFADSYSEEFTLQDNGDWVSDTTTLEAP